MREIEVLRQTRAFLKDQGLADRAVLDLYADAHPTLTSDVSLRPFQRFTLALDGFTVHPDLVGRLDDGETTFAIEVKGTDDLLRGLAQAASYRFGFHLTLLASAAPVPGDVITLARQQHIGLLAATPGDAEILVLPPPHLPILRHAQAIQQQFSTTASLATFTFNLPTHYLGVAIALRAVRCLSLAELECRLRLDYPVLPEGSTSLRAAVAGARKLGLVRVVENCVELTMIGEAAVSLLPDLQQLAQLHQAATRRGATLAGESTQTGAVLRWLLASDPVVELIVTVLRSAGGPLPMPDLARLGLALDRSRALVAFFHPERIDEITDARGGVRWDRVTSAHYRSTTFMQVKSVMKHAGILVPHRLGGTSTRSYDPAADLWELHSSMAAEAV